MQRSALALLFATVAMSGCTTLGGNVKGSFDCKAPNGTCAPMSSIDAQAVNGLGATTTALDGNATNGARIFYAGVGDAEPVRTNDRVLKVVFPAHTDGTGIYRDEAIARVVVERGGWVPGPETIAARTPKGELAASSQAEANAGALKTGSKVGDAMAQASGTPSPRPANAVGAPAGLREVAASLEAAPMPQLEYGQTMTASNDVPVGSVGAPSAEAIAAARAGHRIGGRQSGLARKVSLTRPVDARSARELNQAQLRAMPNPSASTAPQQLARVAFRAPAPAGGSDANDAEALPMTDPIATSGAAAPANGGQPQ